MEINWKMIYENMLIPYLESEIPEGPYLVLAPHPDDESLGMGGTIAIASAKNVDIYIIFATDGEKGGDPVVRKMESEVASKMLGVKKTFHLNLPDRKVFNSRFTGDIISDIIKEVQPKTVFMPSFQEIHPDHRALTYKTLSFFSEKQYTFDLWFYEINRQGEINRLVDISPVIEKKKEAIACYESQLEQIDYQRHTLSMNYARSITLSKKSEYAEGFWCHEPSSDNFGPQEAYFRTLNNNYDFQLIKKNHISSDAKMHCATKNENLISVIIRTKNRPVLLREALKSIADQSWEKIEAVIVNDGLTNLDMIVNEFKEHIFKVTYVKTNGNMGRANAANKGIETASGCWIAFLDDDDLLKPQAYERLIQNATETGAFVVYGKVVRKHLLDDGSQDPAHAEYIYGRPFDRDLLLMENYIPFNALLIKKSVACESFPLREELSLFEDWDFLISLSRKYTFVYLPVQVAVYQCWQSSTATGKRFSPQEISIAEKLISDKWFNINFKNLLAFRNYVVELAFDNERQQAINNVCQLPHKPLYTRILPYLKNTIYDALKKVKNL